MDNTTLTCLILSILSIATYALASLWALLRSLPQDAALAGALARAGRAPSALVLPAVGQHAQAGNAQAARAGLRVRPLRGLTLPSGRRSRALRARALRALTLPSGRRL